MGGGDVGTDPFASVAELLGQRTDLLPQSEDVSDVPALDEAPVDDPQDSDRSDRDLRAGRGHAHERFVLDRQTQSRF